MLRNSLCLLVSVCLLAVAGPATVTAEPTLRALIIDGQNNHGMWPKTTVMMKQYLEQTGLFSVDVARTAYTWQGADLLENYPLEGIHATPVDQPQTDPNFRPKFDDYDVVVSNFGWNAAPWPEETRKAFRDYMENGGGLVIVHAANNSFGDWDDFNHMIGLGGWGGRSEKTGPYVFFNDDGKEVRDESPGAGGSHGPQQPFSIVVRDPDHPITRGMPRDWLHAQDELYDRLRGPAQHMKILATAYAAPSKNGSGRHEPMIMTIEYGKGRVFHTPMGHADYSMECVGFIVSLQRGTEWAATGKVTQSEIPQDFPTANATSQRKFD